MHGVGLLESTPLLKTECCCNLSLYACVIEICKVFFGYKKLRFGIIMYSKRRSILLHIGKCLINLFIFVISICADEVNGRENYRKKIVVYVNNYNRRLSLCFFSFTQVSHDDFD